MDLAELRPDVDSESLVFMRAARLVCACESLARNSRGGYNLPGERSTRERRKRGGRGRREEEHPLRSRAERDVLSRSRYNGLCLQKF